MRNLHCIFGIIGAFCLLSNCTVQQSYLTGSHCDGKCTYLRMGVGRAKSYTILGLGGQNSDNLIFLAKNNLYRTYPLKKSEFYDNFIVNIRHTYLPLIKRTVITIRADIVTNDIVDSDQAFSSSYYEYLGYPTVGYFGIDLADSVVFVRSGQLRKGIVIELSNKNATVMITKNGLEKFISLPQKQLFALENEKLEDECHCEAGQVIEVSASSGEEPKIVKIVGLQKDRALLSITQRNKTIYRIKNFAELHR
ncbi:MAG: hypothetical protein N2662_12785 [Bacteroidales bacterium]|nr:hypothetical protein [Bacteroidales bacterium]